MTCRQISKNIIKEKGLVFVLPLFVIVLLFSYSTGFAQIIFLQDNFEDDQGFAEGQESKRREFQDLVGIHVRVNVDLTSLSPSPKQQSVYPEESAKVYKEIEERRLLLRDQLRSIIEGELKRDNILVSDLDPNASEPYHMWGILYIAAKVKGNYPFGKIGIPSVPIVPGTLTVELSIELRRRFRYPKIEASFKLTKQSLENLGNEGIPKNILKDLKPIENKEIKGENFFLDAVENRIGKEQTVRYKKLILKHAKIDDVLDQILRLPPLSRVWFADDQIETEWNELNTALEGAIYRHIDNFIERYQSANREIQR